MRLLKKAIEKSLAIEERLLLATSQKAYYEGLEIDIEIAERVRERGDEYTSYSREEIKTVRLLRSQCDPQERSPITINNETFHLTELYLKDEISVTFVFS
ncbi:hypothetical protein ELR70_17615 [Pseudoalteromonas sp. R3]|nr:hypothetical protein ELR70_17615 [Pseudoalteromonas sp. R3]